MKMYFLVVICLTFIKLIGASLVSDVTGDVFPDTNGDLLSAFADFNADKKTDLFVIRNNAKEVDILLAEDKGKKYTRQKLLNISDPGSFIICVTPGDYDGDMQMDFLVILSTSKGFQAEIYWSEQTKSEAKIEPSVIISDVLDDQPLVLDWNADRLPDLLAESSGKLLVWLANSNRNFTKKVVKESKMLRKPHSNAFIDLNNDYAADLFLTKENEYEEWYNVDGTFENNKTVPLPSNKFVGQTSFADLNQDSSPEILVPVCNTEGTASCTGSQILLYNNGKWSTILDKFEHDSKVWEFVKENESRGYTLDNKQTFPVTLRLGDFNMDGYPDALAILQVASEKKPRAFLLLNTPCDQSYCSDIGRKLSVQWDSAFSNIDGAVFATFYDIYDDGVLDILLGFISDDKTTQLRAYKNIFTSDACFVKVTVVSGLCNKECTEGREPYGGSNVPGATIKYETITTNGEPQKSCATQLSQSAYYSLQLPYTVFGLGRTPNFVETLGVGMPMPEKTAENHKVFTQIIPNSQLVVIPFPQSDPRYWVLHLFTTPSKTIYITGAVLIGTCGFVAGIVGLLHLYERREDKLEKQQESQKFHFDAM